MGKLKNDSGPDKHILKKMLLSLQRNLTAKILKYIYEPKFFLESILLHLKVLAKLI